MFVSNALLPNVRGEKVSVSPKPATLTRIEQGRHPIPRRWKQHQHFALGGLPNRIDPESRAG